MTFPHLRLRDEVASLLDLPWEQGLGSWDEAGFQFRRLPVGPSRHLVRFLVSGSTVYALKELPAAVAQREYDVLRAMEEAALPAVRVVGLALREIEGEAVLVTEYLRHSMQYRRLLMRLRQVSPGYLNRLLDAMALLLVDLHRSGVYWGDCSLANTLFRREGAHHGVQVRHPLQGAGGAVVDDQSHPAGVRDLLSAQLPEGPDGQW